MGPGASPAAEQRHALGLVEERCERVEFAFGGDDDRRGRQQTAARGNLAVGRR